MYLVQLLLPLYDNEGRPFGEDLYGRVRGELTERFGGLTAYSRAPAHGVWKDEGKTHRDDIVVFEVMAPHLDALWWGNYRVDLEKRFRQDSIVIRAQAILIL
jgi:hypothetical protein